MEYQGPASNDLANVFALNRAFLSWLKHCARDCGLPTETVETFRALDQCRLDRLARMPFLLLSVREYDEAFWSDVFAKKPGMRLLRHMQDGDEDAARLTAATLGFLWQLASSNPYAARLVSGAQLGWCEQLAACTLIDVVARVAEEPAFIEPRSKRNPELWNKLLTSGVSTKRDVRLAARASGLQTLLTGTGHRAHRKVAAAACRFPIARTRVREPM